MNAGVSTSCLYPLETEKSLQILAGMSVKCTEIFFNAPSELAPSFLHGLCEIKDAYGCDVVAIHPFSSGFESFLFFTGYERRFLDGIELYRPYFEAAAQLGAKYVVFHGCLREGQVENERYFERYARLYEAGKEYGVNLCQENVARCKSSRPEFIAEMKKVLGEDANFVLDIKQALRSQVDVTELLHIMGKNLCHLHVSDSAEGFDCLPIGKGEFNFPKLIQSLEEIDYKGALILELYRENFKKKEELVQSYTKLYKFCQKIYL